MKRIFSIAIVLVPVLIISCSKSGSPEPEPNPQPDPTPDPGTISIDMPEAKENKIIFPFFTDSRSADLFSINRKGSNTQANNTAVTVKVKKKDGLVTLFNNTNNTDFELLPDSIYTTAIAGSDNVYTLNLAAGELSKKFTININGAKWNEPHDYAVAFIVTEASGGIITSYEDTVITFLSIRNKWDGVYKVTGTYSDVISASYTANYPYEWELRTTGPNQCVVWDQINLNAPGFIYNVSAGATYYVDFGLVVNFDPATDKIISVVNYYGQPAGNTRSAVLDPSGINSYNNSDKAISIKYFMKQPSTVPTAPNIRASFDEQWQFIKPR